MSETVQTLITSHRFFTGMKHEHIHAISACGQVKKFAAGEYMGRENEPAAEFFAVIDGRVAIESYLPGRHPAVLQTMHGGDVVGWSWLFSPHHWVFDAKALEPTTAIVFNGACLRAACDHNPVLGFELMKRMAHVMTSRLKAARIQLLDLYGHQDKERTFGVGS